MFIEDEGMMNTEHSRLNVVGGKIKEYWLDRRERAIGFWGDDPAWNRIYIRFQGLWWWYMGASLWHGRIHTEEQGEERDPEKKSQGKVK